MLNLYEISLPMGTPPIIILDHMLLTSGSSRRSRSTVCTLKGQNCGGYLGATRTIRAVSDAVVEVDVLAQTGSVRSTTSEGRVLGQHIVEASLTAGGEIGDCGGTGRSASRG